LIGTIPAPDTSDGDAPEEVVVVERRRLELERRVVLLRRRRDLLEDHVEERLQVLRLLAHLLHRVPVAPRSVHDREVELLVVRAELDEEVEDLVEDLVRPRVGPIDLVDHHERAEAVLEGLSQHEARLRHRPLRRVDEEEDRVRHAQRALDLPPEVRVAGRVDDVDARAVPVDRRVLREDRDAPLALLRVGVHRPLLDLLVLPEGPGELEHRVDERRLAVVDVRDDGDVADRSLVLRGHASPGLRGEEDKVAARCRQGPTTHQSSKIL
jgi:hypothetical protein